MLPFSIQAQRPVHKSFSSNGASFSIIAIPDSLGEDQLHFTRTIRGKKTEALTPFTKIEYLDTTGKISNLGALLISDAGIHFMNKNEGFIYGANEGFRKSPVIIRTADGGQTWAQSFIKGLNLSEGQNKGIAHDNLFMFDAKKGCAMLGKRISKDRNYTIAITDDGGLTWKTQHVQLPETNMEFDKAYFSKMGIVTIVFQRNENKGGEHTSIFRSKDFGNRFQLLD
jgi:photosystem II stability/assembly factor-like uncharacterized protein